MNYRYFELEVQRQKDPIVDLVLASGIQIVHTSYSESVNPLYAPPDDAAYSSPLAEIAGKRLLFGNQYQLEDAYGTEYRFKYQSVEYFVSDTLETEEGLQLFCSNIIGQKNFCYPVVSLSGFPESRILVTALLVLAYDFDGFLLFSGNHAVVRMCNLVLETTNRG